MKNTQLSPSFMQPAKSKLSRPRSGFTLIELLTVIAIIAVLASLLLTALASAKKKAKTMTCTSNLHQFSIALESFMDDSEGKRPAVSDLVSGQYLSPQSLLCPEDKTGNWGQLVETGVPIITPTNSFESVDYSYLLQPLTWDDAEWHSLKNNGSSAGVAACQLHGLGNQNTADMRNYSGLLLRAQLDGSVVRRQFFWSPLSTGVSIPAAVGFNNAGPSFSGSLDPLQIFFDDPAYWQGYQ
jgi:prepilin-type N-terminal cleavage/methylation domain-containing protein